MKTEFETKIKNQELLQASNNDCLPCKLAPIIFYIIFDIIGCLTGIVFNPFWVLFEVSLGISYLFSKNNKLKENIIKKISIQKLIGVLTFGIVLRAIIAMYLNKYYILP